MRGMKESGRKVRRKTGRSWLAVALALSVLVISGGAQRRVSAAPAAENAALTPKSVMTAEGAASASDSVAVSVGTPVSSEGIPM